MNRSDDRNWAVGARPSRPQHPRNSLAADRSPDGPVILRLHQAVNSCLVRKAFVRRLGSARRPGWPRDGNAFPVSSVLPFARGCAAQGVLLFLILVAVGAHAHWVAFNDHYRNATYTHSNVTDWNVFGTAGGAPGNAGPLKDITNGTVLPVTLTITNVSVTSVTVAGAPTSGTPAYVTFNGYVHFGSGTVGHSIQIGPGAVMAHVFSGLNPNRRYSFKGTAVRGHSSYTNRWARIELSGADSFTSAHSSNVLTAARVPGALAENEAAFCSGVNHTPETGDIVAWEEVDPGGDGIIVVYSRQYAGPVPGGNSGGAYGYGLTALRLEEVLPTPPGITSEPQDAFVCAGQAAGFSVSVSGSRPLGFQWFKDGVAIPNATNQTHTVPSAGGGDVGGYSVVVTNLAGSVTSRVAALVVSTNPVVIARQPEDQTVLLGTAATFRVGWMPRPPGLSCISGTGTRSPMLSPACPLPVPPTTSSRFPLCRRRTRCFTTSWPATA